MSILVLAEHNNVDIKSSTLNTISAASQISQEIDVLVTGYQCEELAKKKQIDVKEANSLGLDINPRNEQIKVEEPPVRKKGIMVSNVSELVQKLKHEAKVI